MKKMLMLASLLVMSLGVSPSFAASTVNNSEGYITVISCVDKSNAPVLNISINALDLKNLPQSGKFKRKVRAIVASTSKTDGLSMALTKGDLIYDNTDYSTLLFISTFSVHLQLNSKAKATIALNAKTGAHAGYPEVKSFVTVSLPTRKGVTVETTKLTCGYSSI